MNGENVEIISSAGGLCGGTDATLDTGAPREISSDRINLFSVRTSLMTYSELPLFNGKPLLFVSAYAARVGGGALIYLEHACDRYGGTEKADAFVNGGVLSELAAFVKEFGLAKKNGSHSFTYGLPEDFGGRADIRYDGGERISFSNNQSPILSPPACARMAEIFCAALKQPLPPPDGVLPGLQGIIELMRKNDG